MAKQPPPLKILIKQKANKTEKINFSTVKIKSKNLGWMKMYYVALVQNSGSWPGVGEPLGPEPHLISKTQQLPDSKMTFKRQLAPFLEKVKGGITEINQD